jgi:hypothetical protein
MKKLFIRLELAVMQFVLRVYKSIKRMFVKPLELKGMTVEQLLDSKQFRKELEVQIEMEQKHHTEMSYKAVEAGLRLQRAPIQRLLEKGVYDADHIIQAYKLIICKQLGSDFSAAEREHIKQICMMAYWRVVDSNKHD